MFFNGWSELARTAIVGVLAYLGIVFLQRVTGKRTLSKMNSFDLIVTVALGSAPATVILSGNMGASQPHVKVLKHGSPINNPTFPS